MKKNATRILSVLLAAMLLASCSSAPADDGADTTTVPATDTTTVETTTAETEVTDDLPNVKFDNYKFRILVAEDYKQYVFADEQNGQSVNDAVYDANLAVEERFGVEFSTIPQSSWTKSDEIRTLVLSGDDAYDVAYSHDVQSGYLSMEGMFVNLYDVKHLNFEKPWWPKFTTESLTLNGKMYMFSNASSWYGFYATRTMFFNQDLVKANNLPNPYELVYNNEWTLDKLIEMTQGYYKDVNGDGQRDYSDEYGFAMTVPYSLLENFGFEGFGRTADNKSLTLDLYNDGTVALMDKLIGWLASGQPGTVFSQSHSGRYNEDSSNTWFANGKLLYTYGAIGHLLQGLMDTDTNYGILPMPKVDPDGEYIGACCELPGSIPSSATNLDRTGVIVEAMAAEGYKHINPQYYEYALKGRYATDQDSCNMIDLIFENRYLSFTYIYHNPIQQMIENVLTQGGNFASWFEGKKPAAEKRMAEINEWYSGDGKATS